MSRIDLITPLEHATRGIVWRQLSPTLCVGNGCSVLKHACDNDRQTMSAAMWDK